MAKKAAPKAAEAKAAASSDKSSKTKPMTKADVFAALAEKTNLSKKEIANVFGALNDLVVRELSKKGTGMFTIPGMLKLQVKRMPATKAKQGVNPFTKEPMTIKAKPARNVIRARPLKGLKESV